MTILVLEIILSISAILMAVVLFRAARRLEAVSDEDLGKYSIRPHIQKVKNTFLDAVYDFLIAFFKGILHALASLSKHTHLISTRSIARIERAISSAEAELEKNIEEDNSEVDMERVESGEENE